MNIPAQRVAESETSPERAPLRFVTAASLFDGHDAAINIMRRIIQAQGAEVIHLGHNRSVEDVVRAALQEDADAIAMSSYQGGHVEYFKYMIDMLKERGASHIRVFGGGGGTITPEEIRELEDYGVERIYHPNDGMKLGLVEMIEDVVERAARARESRTGNRESQKLANVDINDEISIGRVLSALENGDFSETELVKLRKQWSAASGHSPFPTPGRQLQSSASLAPAAPANPRWSTNCCCASCTRFPKCASPCLRSIRRAAAPVVHCSVIASA